MLLLVGVCAFGQAPTRPYAQMLINEWMVRHPEVSSARILIGDEGKVIASTNLAELGSAATARESRTLQTGTEVQDTSSQNCRATVPIRDVSGEVAGAISLSFRSIAGSASCVSKAHDIATELKQVIPTPASLLDPYIVATMPTDTLAQRLTIDTLNRNPDLLVLAFHVTAPGDTVNKVVGVNQTKFVGRASDDVDHEVAKTGKTIVQIIPKTHRMETHMPLRAADGSLVGTVVTVFLWQREDEAPGLIARSMKLRDQLQPSIPNLASLLER